MRRNVSRWSGETWTHPSSAVPRRPAGTNLVVPRPHSQEVVMGLHLSRRGYSVRVDEMLLRGSRFVIRAEIEYATRLSLDEWMRLSPMAQLDLLLGIEGAEV